MSQWAIREMHPILNPRSKMQGRGIALHFSAWKQNGGVDSLHLFLAMRLNYPPKSSISPERDGTSYFPTTVEAVPWRRPCSSRTASSVLTQKAHFSPACFASGSKCAFLASETPVRSMRP